MAQLGYRTDSCLAYGRSSGHDRRVSRSAFSSYAADDLECGRGAVTIAAVTAKTLATIKASGGGATTTAVLIINPSRCGHRHDYCRCGTLSPPPTPKVVERVNKENDPKWIQHPEGNFAA